MDEQRIQKQIAIYMTDKKLCEFNDKLKLAPVDYYAHVHAQGEKQEDGSRQRSCIGMVLQDYSNGTGDKTVRVMANLSPEFFAYALSRVSIGVENFDFNEEKIFGEPDSNGLSVVTKTTIKRASYAAAHNLSEQSGLHDALGVLLNILGTEVELSSSTDRMIAITPNAGCDYLHLP